MKKGSIIIKDVTNEIDEEHRKLYDIFPSNEIFPVENIRNACQEEKYKILKFYNKELEIGTTFIAILNESKFIIISFLYVTEKLRNMGYGHKIVEVLKKKYNEYNGIIVEVEPFNDSINQEKDNIRVKFYIDLDFEDIKLNYSILQTEEAEYQKILLYVCNLKKEKGYNYTYVEVQNILDEYFMILFHDDFKEQYKLE